MSKISDIELTRLNNRRSILHYLRVNGPTARIDLSDSIQLSAATVTELTSALINEGFIREVRGASVKAGGRGRPKVLIELVPTSIFVLGVKLTLNQVDIVLGDYTGSITRSQTYKVDTLKLDEQSLNTLFIELIERFQREECENACKIMSIGIAVQGVVDSSQGRIVWSYAVSARNIAVSTVLENIFNCPVTLLNDANCIALALQQNCAFNRCSDMAVIMLGYGVGMGLVVHSKLYNGGRGAAAEFGHTKFQLDGPLCHCGMRGCIEAYVGDYAIYRDAVRLIDLPETDFRHPSDEDMNRICNAAREGNKDIQKLFELAGRSLGYGIANLIALFSPKKVLITGSGVRSFDLMEQEIHSTVNKLLVSELRDNIDITPIPWEDDLTEIGAIKHALLVWEDQHTTRE